MASTFVDEFVQNFDLNQLSTDGNIRAQTDQKYEKLRKYTSWLKSKIISTDFAIQKYQGKKDDYEQSVKAHCLTKDELRQACINYQEALQKCEFLEKENKIFMTNQDVLKAKVTEIETKYDALLSHTNQLQVLIKQLENEKDALTVERALEKCNNVDSKDGSKEIMELQKEKDKMLKDIMAFKDVILGKRKTSKKHVKLMKKYFKDTDPKGKKMLGTSEESDYDMDNCSDLSSPNLRNLNQVHNITDKEFISSIEHMDHYSDAEMSVDTGRGSSRANSHDKCLSSPDYVVSLETLLKLPPKNLKQIDVATSPILLYPPRSVATSPIMFDPAPVLENEEYNDYVDCFNDQEYVDDNDDDVPLSDDIDILVAQEKLSECASPVSDACNFTDIATEVVEHNNYIILKECSDSSFLCLNSNESNEFNQGSIVEKEIKKCSCQKSDTIIMNDSEKFVDACTSPFPLSIALHKFIDIGTSTMDHFDSITLDNSNDFKNRISRYCEKSTSTDCLIISERKDFVNVCTSPIGKLYNCYKSVDVGTNTEECHNQSENSTNSNRLKKKLDASVDTDLIPFKHPKTSGKGIDMVHQKQKKMSLCFDLDEQPVVDKFLSKSSYPTKVFRNQEKVCLESNSSKNLSFESTNDTEVQNILNVMKLHHNLISPISKTPCDSHYLKLIPEMHSKITKIWNTLTKAYRIPNRPRNSNSSPLDSIEIDDIDDIPEVESNNGQKNSAHQNLENISELNQVIDEDIIESIETINSRKNSSQQDLKNARNINRVIDEDILRSTETNSSNKNSVEQYLQNVRKPNQVVDKNVMKCIETDSSQKNSSEQDLENVNNVHIVLDEDILESTETNNNKRIPAEQHLENVKILNQVSDDDMIECSNKTNLEKSNLSTDLFLSEPLNISTNENNQFNVSNSSSMQLHRVDKLMPDSRRVKIIVMAKENKTDLTQRHGVNDTDLNKNCEDYNNITSNINENNLATDINNQKIDIRQQCITNNSELNDFCEDNVCNNRNNINNIDCSINEEPKSQTIIMFGTKTKKKSKLEKFRKKLLPTCKIRKMSPILKQQSKLHNIKPKDTNISASLNQKIAYEKAVKVMAELRSKQELQDKRKEFKPATSDIDLKNTSNTSNNIESSSEMLESRELVTRSRTRRLSKKEDDKLPENTEHSIKDIKKSPINRKTRKRPADTEVDDSQSCKRILRSSNVSLVANDTILPVISNVNAIENVRNNFKDDKEFKEHVSHSDELLRNSQNFQNNQSVTRKSDMTFEKSLTKRMKPVIELSKCLTDDSNVVSMIHGNVGYLDVNKNINCTNTPESNSHMSDNQINYSPVNKQNLEITDGLTITQNLMQTPEVDHSTKQNITDTAFKEASKVIMETQSGNSPKNKDHNSSLELKLRQEANICTRDPVVQIIPLKTDALFSKHKIVSYSDLDLFTMGTNTENVMPNAPPMITQTESRKSHTENILCTALDRYGVISVKYTAEKVPETVTLKISQKIEETIPKIIASPKSEQKSKMDELVNYLQMYNVKSILAGLVQYLKDPTRKNELFNKIVNGAAPPMTKSEVILLYVIKSLDGSLRPGFVNRVWNNIEHALFQLNRAPGFDVIESMSHFYAVLCRYFRNKSRLRCFMLDAMYCLQFKAVPLIKQCLDVCPGVLPSAHEHMAKTSLVTCLVYLLHFYKCQDKYNRAQDIRNILCRKYRYQFSEWNETMILEIFRKAIMDLRGTQNDKKMLRVALIILCKRHGPKWCQLNIIQNILMPIIEKKDVPDRIKQFCVLMLGPLLKPFPADKKAQCEIVINQLLQMLKQTPSHEMKESIYSSLIFMNKHDQERVVRALLSWNPERVSPDFEEILNDYVMEKPLAVWKKLVIRKPSQCS